MDEHNNFSQSGQPEQPMARVPVNGGVFVEVTEDKLHAYLYITEERDGGEPVTSDDINRVLEVDHLLSDVDYDAANQLLADKKYNKKVCVAKGYLPTHGTDGTINYLFDPSNTLVPKKGSTGEVDYKDLGLVRNITKGEIIAEITQPTTGEEGQNVYGQPLMPVAGKPVRYIVGTGTELTETETEIIAAVSGNLTWAKDRFTVSETLVIPENVDVSTGNIDFIGNVVVKGNVAENFSVKSKLSVSVNGTVTNATVIAGGDVMIALGSVNSDIIAQGTVKLGFCESSRIECKRDFISQSVIGGEVFCAGEFNATGGRGVVFGGKYTALSGFNANIIGTENYTKTQITLGNSAVLSEEKVDITDKIKDLEDRTKKLLQVAEVLNTQKKSQGQLSADREAMLTTAIRSRFTFQREVKQLNKRLEEIESELESAGDQSVIVHKHLWPGVVIRVGTELLIVDRHMTSVLIGKDQEGVLSYLPYKKP
ncbi:MAG: FapA family protein [Oscillospiraceae bacterium]|nr:FapA family protein [Oscillospiraceae bacterium]